MLSEFRRVLRPGGMLIISTPNRVEYTDRRDFHNEFHVRELYEAEFRALLSQHFPAQSWFGQKLLFNSAIWPEPTKPGSDAAWLTVGATERAMPAPMYFIVLAAQSEADLPPAGDVTLLADPSETMYREYIQTVARTSALEQVVAAREKLVVDRDRVLTLWRERISRIEAIIAERDEQLAA